jgi:hypothetical protein
MSLVPYTLLYLLLSYGFFDIQLTYQKKKKKFVGIHLCVVTFFFFFWWGGKGTRSGCYLDNFGNLGKCHFKKETISPYVHKYLGKTNSVPCQFITFSELSSNSFPIIF